ncbi:MAG: family 1 encapsulin nanocompartment shell protein [Thermodesulfobacteriota bacterium]
MDLLKRDLAPILSDAWRLIDEEASRVLRLHLAARKLVDVDGPYGWHHAAVNVGRIAPVTTEEGPLRVEGVAVGVRRVQPLIELRASFELSMRELDNVARGAKDLALDAAVTAAERIARVEDAAVFYGLEAAGIQGIVPSSPHQKIALPASVVDYPRAVAEALEVLRKSGIAGPFALALGPKSYSELSQGAEEGYPIRKRIEQQLIDGPLVWAPALEGALVLSLRGGDFALTIGHDLSVGYDWHDKEAIALYLTESFTFRVLEPAAAVYLSH